MITCRAGKIRFSGTQKSVLFKASPGECFAPCDAMRCTCSPHRVTHHVRNEIDYRKINVQTNSRTAAST